LVPQIKYRAGKLEPFAEVLLGGAHTNFYANACNQNTGECGSKSPSNNAFALAIGGGVDIVVSSKVAIRLVDADYELFQGEGTEHQAGDLSSGWLYSEAPCTHRD